MILYIDLGDMLLLPLVWRSCSITGSQQSCLAGSMAQPLPFLYIRFALLAISLHKDPHPEPRFEYREEFTSAIDYYAVICKTCRLHVENIAQSYRIL